MNRAKPYLKSEKIPEPNDKFVEKVVGYNFYDVVFNTT
jgi:hypothetical protein